ncbi:MAG: hypothetical protein ABIF18_00415 [archaeon]
MVSLKLEVKKKDLTWLVPLFVVLVVGIVYAYGTSNPEVMGHSAGELEITWDDISGIPEDLVYEADITNFADVGDTSALRIKTGTYVGNAVNNRHIDVGFQPKEVWIQDNNVAYWTQYRWDTMKAGTSHMTGSSGYYTNSIKSFDATGFTIGTYVGVNQNAHVYSYRVLGE